MEGYINHHHGANTLLTIDDCHHLLRDLWFEQGLDRDMCCVMDGDNRAQKTDSASSSQ